MEEIFNTLFTQEITITGLLLFIIISLLKGWAVPFWQVDEMKEKLKAYEEKAPELLKEVEKLIELQKEENERAKEQPYTFIRRSTPLVQRRAQKRNGGKK